MKKDEDWVYIGWKQRKIGFIYKMGEEEEWVYEGWRRIKNGFIQDEEGLRIGLYGMEKDEEWVYIQDGEGGRMSLGERIGLYEMEKMIENDYMGWRR